MYKIEDKHTINHLPVIDVSGLWKQDENEWNKVVNEIDNISRNIGFFYIVGHPIKEERMEKMLELTKEFFRIPLEKKMEADMSKNKFHRGYGSMYLEQLNPSSPNDEKETLEMGVKLPSDHPLLENKLYGPNLYPNALDQTSIHQFEQHYEDMKQLLKMLLRAMAQALKLDREYFAQHFDYPMASMRIMHYTSNSGNGNDPNQLGGGEHTDYGCLTILQQDSVGGLQVKTLDNKWIDVPYIKGSFVVNIGDMLQRWSNDIYRSTAHRVLKPPKGVDRYSIPFFGEPHIDTLVSCIPSCCSADTPQKYEPVKAGDYLLSRFLDTYDYKKKDN